MCAPLGEGAVRLFNKLLRVDVRHASAMLSSFSRLHSPGAFAQVTVAQGSLRASISGGEYRQHTSGKQPRNVQYSFEGSTTISL